MNTRNIGILGASGRMGSAVAGLIENEFSGEAVVAARVGGREDTLDDFSRVDAIIDFSLPAGTVRLMDWLEAQEPPLPALVSGTTGLSDEEHDRLRTLAETTRVLHATNFSPGVAAVTSILGFAAPILDQLGYRPVLTEVHHEHKQDAPSGTAKTFCRTIDPDRPSSTQVHSIRAGEVIGRHDVVFYGPSDRIVISHEAMNRDLFARGAVEAALWLCGQAEGGYCSMEEYFTRRYLG